MSEAPAADLDDDQSSVAAVSAGTRQIVLAGPGSGKTQVVAALVEHLTEEEGLSPTDELLVISFSRAAVAAVRRRTAVTGSPKVTVRTLDALAARVLDELDDTDDWRRLAFDRRVVRATTLLDGAESEELGLLGHLIVDEVQDIVGARAELLLEIISSLPATAGFTLLGDPMQALYDFQLDDKHPMTSAQLLEVVRKGSDVEVKSLRGQYRARTDEAATILSLGGRLQGLDLRARAQLLDRTLSGVITVGPVDGLARLVPRWSGTTAVLCRTNGEALLAASMLRADGLPVQLQRSAQEFAATPAIAALLADSSSGLVSRSEVADRAEAIGLADGARIAVLLADLVHRRGSDIDVPAVGRRLAAGIVPMDLQLEPEAVVVVSTVHRAKGLEFDNVALVGAMKWLSEIGNLPDSVPAAFVALTRLKERVVTTSPIDTRRLWPDGRSGRWIRGGPKRWMTFGFELRGSDTRRPEPPGDSPADVQAYLASGAVRAGDPVDLALDPLRSTLELPVYAVTHGGIRIGATGVEFGEALVRRVRPARARKTGRPWPGLAGAVVDAVETVGGSPQPGAEFGGAGRWGVWLSVRLTALLQLEWGD